MRTSRILALAALLGLASAAAAADLRVVQRQKKFLVDRLDIRVGDTVRFVNDDEVSHNLYSATPGMHRFVWPIRYLAPTALAEGNPYANGVWAPPGQYTVELSVGGRRQTQAFTVVPDPRVAMAA